MGLDQKVTVCPGYSTGLPEVGEVALAHAHWKHGELAGYCAPAAPSEQLLDLVVEREAAIGAVTMWALTPKKDGGGGA